MYRVTIITDGIEYLLHEPRDSDGLLQLIDPVMTMEAGKGGTFVFRIAPTHPNKGRIKTLKSEVYLYQDDELLFCGRPIGNESDFYNIGKVTCEGELVYLFDSIQRPFNFEGNTTDFMRQLLDIHNSQVDEWKRFELGNVTVADSSAQIVRSSKECINTFMAMRKYLTNINGGYLRVRRAGGKKYLDYVSDYGGINSQVIRFGENLLDLTEYTKPVNIITALIPYGATIESADTETEDRPIDITSVNGGSDYIYDRAAVSTYGWVWGTQTFEDVTNPADLLTKAKAYLQETIVMPVTLELKALDLSLIDVNAKALKLGCWTYVESIPHKISKRFMLSKKTVHLSDPEKDEVVLGQTRMTFTESTAKEQAKISERIERVATSTSREINRKIENATMLITGGKGGYVVLDVYDPDTGDKTHPWRILIMDTPDKDTAKSVIQINRNGIGFSTTGINGPYRNAWTIDGNLVADFITSGTMLADRIRGGILEVGGAGLARDGSITVKDANGNVIGKWDKTGLHVYMGEISGTDIIGGTINIGGGRFTVNKDGSIALGEIFDSDGNYFRFGDYSVSADGSNELSSNNGWVKINTSDRPAGSPGGECATIHVGGDGYRGVDIYGYGYMRCPSIDCSEISFPYDSWTDGMGALAMFKQIYSRLNQIQDFTGMGAWDE